MNCTAGDCVNVLPKSQGEHYKLHFINRCVPQRCTSLVRGCGCGCGCTLYNCWVRWGRVTFLEHHQLPPAKLRVQAVLEQIPRYITFSKHSTLHSVNIQHTTFGPHLTLHSIHAQLYTQAVPHQGAGDMQTDQHCGRWMFGKIEASTCRRKTPVASVEEASPGWGANRKPTQCASTHPTVQTAASPSGAGRSGWADWMSSGAVARRSYTQTLQTHK